MTLDISLPVAISYSGGSSSGWIIEAVIRGILPRPGHLAVFFADTGDEHEWTYEAVDRVERRCASEGIAFIRCERDELLVPHLKAINSEGRTRADHPPLWVKKGHGRGRIEHRCTREFKIAPMRRAQSAWLKELGLPKRITKWIGFGADEQARATKSLSTIDVQWERLDFPAVRISRKRHEQHADLRRWTGQRPEFSMCRSCPYKSPSRWRATTPKDLESVYDVDEAIRDMTNIDVTEGDCYLTDRLIPVEQLIKKGDPQPTLPGLEAYCDGGACFL